MVQGRAAQPRSPASQNIMPRNWPLSASTSTSVTSAPQALATTTPVSSTRTVAPPRASASTSRVASTAPAAAADCTSHSDAADQQRQQRAERRTARTRRGHRSRPADCETAPAAARLPRRAARQCRMRTARAAGAVRGPRYAPARRDRRTARPAPLALPMSVEPATRLQPAMPAASTNSSANRRVGAGREITAHCPFATSVRALFGRAGSR